MKIMEMISNQMSREVQGTTPGLTKTEKPKTLLFIACHQSGLAQSADMRLACNYLQRLIIQGVSVVFMADGFSDDDPVVANLRDAGAIILTGSWHKSKWDLWLSEHNLDIDYICLFQPFAVSRYIEAAKTTKAKRIYFATELNFRRIGDGGDDQEPEIASNWRQQELSFLNEMDVLYYSSPSAVSELRRHFPNKIVRLVPEVIVNIVDQSPYDLSQRSDLLICGDFADHAVLDGTFWFISKIFPEIIKVNEPIKLAICGANIPASIIDLDSENISISPEISIDELGDFARKFRVGVFPWRLTDGNRQWMLQCMANQLPLIVSDQAVVNLPGTVQECFAPINDPILMAGEIEELCKNEKYWRRKVNLAVSFLESNFSARTAYNALSNDIKLSPFVNFRTPFPDGHFYSPVINPQKIKEREEELWPAEGLNCPGVNFQEENQINLLENEFPGILADFQYPKDTEQTKKPYDFFLNNGQFEGLDPILLSVILHKFKPRRMIEVGSGFSSLLTADINRTAFSNKLEFTCIEPYPRDFLLDGVPGITSLLVAKVEDVDLAVFQELKEDDILFIDSSHVCKTGSDVNFLFFRVIPLLRPGVIIHVHDIFLPQEYPQKWVLGEHRSWNEQYLLQALLMYSAKFEVVFGSNYAFTMMPEKVELVCGEKLSGGSFWFKIR